MASAILAADAGVKGVKGVKVRLVEAGKGALERPELLVRDVVIPQLHPGMWENVAETTWFGARARGKP